MNSPCLPRGAGSGCNSLARYIPGIYRVYSMPELGVRSQCIFLAVYASCILLCAVTMASQQAGAPVLTEMERFVCCSCEKRGFPSFFVSKRAVHNHITKSKMCKGDAKRITVMTRPGDVIAGGTGGMGPCPPPQHQPPGI